MYIVRPSYLIKKVYPEAIWRFSSTEKIIYLTFDDGPMESITPWVLEVLKKYKIAATFFCVGENIERYPEIYNRIIEEGHTTGNHTYNHLKGWKTNTEEYLKNVELCEKTMNPLVAPSSIKTEERVGQRFLFRPPYGKIKKSQYSYLKSKYSIVMWDVLSGDYDKKTSHKKCLNNVIKNTRNGSIVLFHDSIKAESNLKYTLVPFIEWALKEGYCFKKIAY